MNYLLDTCVISEFTKITPYPPVLGWIEAQVDSHLYLSVLSLGELEKGIQKLAEGKKRETLKFWVENDLMPRFSGRILPVEEDVALAWGAIQAAAERSGKTMPLIDGYIAATALTHGLTVVTRNNPDMEASGVPLVNPWK